MTWTEIWINYLQPIVAFLIGSGIMGLIAKMLANGTFNKLYNKKNVEKVTKDIVDKVAVTPFKIDIEDKVETHLKTILEANKKEINELKSIIKAQNNVFKRIAELFNESYAISEETKNNLKNAIEEVEQVAYVEKEEDKQIVVNIQPKNTEQKVEKKTTIQR